MAVNVLRGTHTYIILSKAVAFYEITKGGYTIKQCSFSPLNVMLMQSSKTFTPLLYLRPMKMEQTECSEMLAYKIQTPGNYPEESIQHTEHGESLKSRIYIFVCGM